MAPPAASPAAPPAADSSDAWSTTKAPIFCALPRRALSVPAFHRLFYRSQVGASTRPLTARRTLSTTSTRARPGTGRRLPPVLLDKASASDASAANLPAPVAAAAAAAATGGNAGAPLPTGAFLGGPVVCVFFIAPCRRKTGRIHSNEKVSGKL